MSVPDQESRSQNRCLLQCVLRYPFVSIRQLFREIVIVDGLNAKFLIFTDTVPGVGVSVGIYDGSEEGVGNCDGV